MTKPAKTRKTVWSSITEIMEDTAKRFTEDRLSAIIGEPVRLTKRQLNAYCKARAAQEREDEVEAAVDLLEREGYSVQKRRKR